MKQLVAAPHSTLPPSPKFTVCISSRKETHTRGGQIFQTSAWANVSVCSTMLLLRSSSGLESSASWSSGRLLESSPTPPSRSIPCGGDPLTRASDFSLQLLRRLDLSDLMVWLMEPRRERLDDPTELSTVEQLLCARAKRQRSFFSVFEVESWLRRSDRDICTTEAVSARPPGFEPRFACVVLSIMATKTSWKTSWKTYTPRTRFLGRRRSSIQI